MIQIFEDITNILYIKYSANIWGNFLNRLKVETLSKLTDKSKLYLNKTQKPAT